MGVRWGGGEGETRAVSRAAGGGFSMWACGGDWSLVFVFGRWEGGRGRDAEGGEDGDRMWGKRLGREGEGGVEEGGGG